MSTYGKEFKDPWHFPVIVPDEKQGNDFKITDNMYKNYFKINLNGYMFDDKPYPIFQPKIKNEYGINDVVSKSGNTNNQKLEWDGHSNQYLNPDHMSQFIIGYKNNY